ncbi:MULTISPECIES: hypothetical protein [unclassified Meiothermus]|uniref:hypothetical protein n=1 Tax=unclassified Meiothermus TaxID=370471 RepID=UPI000D7BBB15|nr:MULTISPECIES: hypothetical protein [unclassified Meiothermus]PZA07886.1 hypothetical protein DNA98_06175 [Meiothermus sp. Pnk-1]RYM38807.1 hypothetical protein EWH23_03510 [Meiothermus sp. PNK-Is4]
MYALAALHLELAQEFLAKLLTQQLSTLDIPLEIPWLHIPLGRLQGGEVKAGRLEPGSCQLEVTFASGPSAEVRLRLLEFCPDTQTLDLELEEFRLSGFAGAGLARLARRKLLEVTASRANAQLPGLVTLGKGMRWQLHFGPLWRKVLRDSQLRQTIESRLGLKADLSLRARAVHLEEGKAVLELEGQLS